MLKVLESFLKLPTKAIIVILGVFAINVGSMLIIPIFASHLANDLKFSLQFVAAIMTLKLVSQWGLSIVGGVLSDRFGPKQLLVAGMFVRACSFFILAQFSSYTMIVVGTLLMGLGASLFIPASKSMLTCLTEPSQRFRAFSYRYIAVNLGTAVGPLIGMLLPFHSFGQLCISMGSAFLLLGVIFLLIRFDTHMKSTQISKKEFSWNLLLNPYVLGLMGIMAGFFVFYAQLEFALPVYSTTFSPKDGPFAIFLVNSVVVVLAQFLLIKFLEKKSNLLILILGFLFFGLAYASLMIMPEAMLGIIVCVIFFSLAELMIAPKVDAALSNAVPARFSGTTMGISGITQGVGAAVGNYLGSHLSFKTKDVVLGRLEVASLWLVLAALSLVFCVLCYFLLSKYRGASADAENPIHT